MKRRQLVLLSIAAALAAGGFSFIIGRLTLTSDDRTIVAIATNSPVPDATSSASPTASGDTSRTVGQSFFNVANPRPSAAPDFPIPPSDANPENENAAPEETTTPQGTVAGTVVQPEFQPEGFGITQCDLDEHGHARVVVDNTTSRRLYMYFTIYAHLQGSTVDWQIAGPDSSPALVEPNHHITFTMPWNFTPVDVITDLRCVTTRWGYF